MSLLSIIIALVAVGILLYCINTLIPIDGTVRKIINAVVILVLLVWLLKAFGVWAPLASVHL